MFNIPIHWSWSTVEVVASPQKYSCVGGPFGSKLGRKNYISVPGIPVIRGKNLGDGAFFDENFVYVSLKKAKTLRANTAYPGDLIFTQRGTLGQVGRIPLTAKYKQYIVSQSQMKLTLNEIVAEPNFIFYFFRSSWALNYIYNNAITTGVPHINLGILRSFPVPLPPLDEQKRIAHVLGTLDDKIELNRKMNKSLEAMAQALFKSWFVDFDPVIDNTIRAGNPIPKDLEEKAERRRKVMARDSYKISKYSDVFPDSFVNSELGPIPENWELTALGEFAYRYQKSISPLEVDPNTPYFGLADIPSKDWSLSSWSKAEDVSSNKSEFQKNDILFGRLRPYFKKVGIAPIDGICSSDILVIKPKEEPYWGFILALLITDDFIEFSTKVSTGTRMPRVSWKNLASYSCPIPSEQMSLAVFTDLIIEFTNVVISNNKSSQKLEKLRDALLPKLISGGIQVSVGDL